jgi:exosortase/archaeosortase family protein
MASGNPANSGLPATRGNSTYPGLRFAVIFIIAATITAALMTDQHSAFSAFVRTVTIPSTMALGSLLGLAMTSNADILTVNGFAMQIIDQCTALNYIIILTLAILLYTHHSFKYRLAGVAVATFSLLIANAIRLIFTGMAGAASPKVFFFVHEYFWVALFALLVFGIWKVWADKGLNLTRQTARQVGLIAISCTGVYLLLIAFRDEYCRLLATLATPLFKMLLGDSQASLVWDGSLRYTLGGVSVRMGLFFEMANIAVYVGLMLPYLWHNRKGIPLALLGLVALIVLYAEFIGIMGINALRHGIAVAEFFHFIGSGVFLALPMALYWMVTGPMGKDKSGKGEMRRR